MNIRINPIVYSEDMSKVTAANATSSLHAPAGVYLVVGAVLFVGIVMLGRLLLRDKR